MEEKNEEVEKATKILKIDPESYRIVFRSVLSIIVVFFAATFMYKVAFIESESLNEHTGVVLGFITGTAFATILNYYLGSSDKGNNKKEE
jgi:hypothetical protein